LTPWRGSSGMETCTEAPLSGLQAVGGMGQRLVRTQIGQQQPHSPSVEQHNGADLQQFQSNSAGPSVGELAADECDPTNGFEQRKDHGGEPQALLVQPPCVATQVVGEQVESLFLDPVLHVAAGAIQLIVQSLRRALQTGDNTAGIGTTKSMFGLDDQPSEPSVPDLGGLWELVEYAHFIATYFVRHDR